MPNALLLYFFMARKETSRDALFHAWPTLPVDRKANSYASRSNIQDSVAAECSVCCQCVVCWQAP